MFEFFFFVPPSHTEMIIINQPMPLNEYQFSNRAEFICNKDRSIHCHGATCLQSSGPNGNALISEKF